MTLDRSIFQRYKVLSVFGPLLLIDTPATAQSIIDWVNQNTPVNVIAPTTSAQCEALRNKWDSLSRRINEEHNRCLQIQGKQRGAQGKTCQYAACEELHVLMNDRSLSEKRRNQVNACFADLRANEERQRTAKARQAEADRRFNESAIFGETTKSSGSANIKPDLTVSQEEAVKAWVNLLNSEERLNGEYDQALEKHRALQDYARTQREQQAKANQRALEGNATLKDRVKELYENAVGKDSESSEYDKLHEAYELGEGAYDNRRYANPKTAATEFRKGGREISGAVSAIEDYWDDVLTGVEKVEAGEIAKQFPWKETTKSVGKQAVKETAKSLVGGAVGLADLPEAGQSHIDDNPAYGEQRERIIRQERERGETFAREREARERQGGPKDSLSVPNAAYRPDPYKAELRADHTPPSLYSSLGQVKDWVSSHAAVTESWPFIDKVTHQMGRVTKENASDYQPGHQTCSTLRIEIFGKYDKREEVCQ